MNLTALTTLQKKLPVDEGARRFPAGHRAPFDATAMPVTSTSGSGQTGGIAGHLINGMFRARATGMLLLRLALFSCLSSSCVAVPIVGATVALRASDEEQQEVEGYHRLLALRTHEARTAAEIRQRWNASNANTAPEVDEAAAPPATQTTEPHRRPLKPAAR